MFIDLESSLNFYPLDNYNIIPHFIIVLYFFNISFPKSALYTKVSLVKFDLFFAFIIPQSSSWIFRLCQPGNTIWCVPLWRLLKVALNPASCLLFFAPSKTTSMSSSKFYKFYNITISSLVNCTQIKYSRESGYRYYIYIHI